jgi:hypothetical protein
MIRILLNFNRLSQSDLRIFAELIFSKMDGNAKYIMFQALVTILGALAAEYKVLLFAQDGSEEKRNAKNAKLVELKEFLSKLAGKVEVAANDLPSYEREAFAKGTGFSIPEAGSTPRVNAAFLEVPASFKVIDDNQPFAAFLSWSRVFGANSYLIEEFKEGVWHNCGSVAQLSIVVGGTETNIKRTFRVKAANADGVMSDYTREVNVWVY